MLYRRDFSVRERLREELDEPVHLVEYDPEWPALFASEARRLAAILPADLEIEHIGSTAVPGLSAKPIIDLMAGAPPTLNFELLCEKLVSAGYRNLGEAGVPGRIYLRRRTENAFNLHLVSRTGPLWEANLAFRDYLRAHPPAVREYAELKRDVVQSGAVMLLAYSDFKREAVSRLVRCALEWKMRRQAGP